MTFEGKDNTTIELHDSKRDFLIAKLQENEILLHKQRTISLHTRRNVFNLTQLSDPVLVSKITSFFHVRFGHQLSRDERHIFFQESHNREQFNELVDEHLVSSLRLFLYKQFAMQLLLRKKFITEKSLKEEAITLLPWTQNDQYGFHWKIFSVLKEMQLDTPANN